MATRSTIAVRHADGTVSQIYCHFDGYLDGNGKTLQECYPTREAAEELVAGGDMSSLDSSVDTCVYYKRDRGEAEADARIFANMNSYYENLQSEEYNYLFLNGQWFVDEPYGDRGGEYIPLAEALENA
jgi:hypothetical protein